MLPSVMEGLLVDDAARQAAADDFGHIVHRPPEGVLVPASAEDLAAAIRWAAQVGVPVAARGGGHSTFGRAQAPGGIVADMSALGSIGPVEVDRVTVGAGASWREVVAATLPCGLTPPVLADHLDLSVGGTLVVGGVGATISAHGLQSDNVLAMEVVTGAGEVMTCSPDERADLFDAVRAGLGQVAVITRATLRLVPAPRLVRRSGLVLPDLASMLAEGRALAADPRVDAIRGAIVAAPEGAGLEFRLEAIHHLHGAAPAEGPDVVPYIAELERLDALEAALRARGWWGFPHPWLTTFVGDSRVEEVVGAELARLDPPADLGPFGQVIVSPVRRSAVASPLLRLPADDLCFTFNLIRLPATEDPAEVVRLVEANRAVHRRVRAAGGTLYPVSASRCHRPGGASTSGRRTSASARRSARTTRRAC
jgi:FAD/FMN-containing dehydrogenase